MKKMTILFLFISTLTHQAFANSTCVDYLSNSEKTDLVPLATKSQIQAYQNQVLSESLTAQLIQAGILHSFFFKTLIQVASKEPWSKSVDFRFDTAEKISILNKNQTDRLALLLYNVLKHEFENQGDSISIFSDARFSKKVFMNASKEELIDKIGESLIIIGTESDFYEYSKEIQKIKDPNASIFIPGMFGAAGSVGSGFFLLMDSIAGYRDSIFFNSIWQNFTGVSIALVAIPIILQSRKNKKASDIVLNDRLAAHDTLEGTYTVEPSLDYIEGEYAKNLEPMRSRITELTSLSEVPNLRNLLTFGNKAAQLHRELNLTFHTDFMKWMFIYERNKDEVKKRIHAIRNRRLNTNESKREVLNFLGKMLQEASEATVLTSELSHEIISIIEKDIGKLSAMTIDETNTFLARDFHRRLDFLRLARVTHAQFLLSLEPIHVTISNLMQSIETLGLAESAALTMDLGTVSKELDQDTALESILTGLGEMDSYLVKLKKDDSSIVDAEIVED